MQKIKRFIKDIPFKRVLICKTIQKGSKSWNSSQIWLFFKTYKCIFKTQNSWHFFCNTDTVCCLQKLFHLGWLGSHLKLNGCKLLNSFFGPISLLQNLDTCAIDNTDSAHFVCGPTVMWLWRGITIVTIGPMKLHNGTQYVRCTIGPMMLIAQHNGTVHVYIQIATR